MKKIVLAIGFGLLAAWSSCRKENNDNVQPANRGDVYFPLTIGQSAVYDVTSIHVDKASGINDTMVYQLKRVVDTCFLDDEKDTVWRVLYYWRETWSEAWKIKEAQMEKRNAENVQAVENNRRYVKLVFPVRVGREWDGNYYNNLDPEMYKITSVTAETIGKITYQSVVTVEQHNEESLISKKYKVEKYAAGIGLVYKKYIDLYSQDVVSGLPLEQRIERGTVFIQTLRSIDQ